MLFLFFISIIHCITTFMKRFTLILFLIIFSLNNWAQLNTNHVIHTGRSRLYFGNYTGAIESFNMVIRMKPHLPEPYFYRGVAKLNLEDYYGALNDLNKALEIKPFYPEAYMYRGVTFYNLQEYSKAMDDYSEAMKLDGENADIFNNRGICKAAMRDFEGAVDDYTQSINLKPKNFNAYLNRSIAYQMLEQWDKAIDDCNQLIRIRPNSAMGYMSRGLIKIEKEDYAGALRDFDMAIYLDPQNAFAYQNRGLVKQQLESYEAAIMDYNIAIELDNRMASAYFNRGVAREVLGADGYQNDYRYAELLDPRYAKRPWLTAEEREQQQQQMLKAWNTPDNDKENDKKDADSISTNDEMRIDLEDLKRRKMRANLVVEDIRDIPGNENEDTGKIQDQNIEITLLPLFGISIIDKNSAGYGTIGYFNLAIEKLNEAYNYQPYLTLSNQPEKNKQATDYYKNQILIFDQLINQNANIGNNYLYRGILKSLTSDYQNAITDFDQAIKLDERNLLAYLMRANTRFEMTNAIQNYKQSQNLKPLDQSINGALSSKDNKLEISNQALDEIFTDYSVVLYMNPDFSFAYFNRGNLYVKTERYFDALEEYNKAISIDPDFAEAYYNRGLLKVLLNNIESGAKDLSRAGELGITESYNVIKRYCN